MPDRNPVNKLYVVAGEAGEVRLIETAYPEKIVTQMVTGRNHHICAILNDIADVRLMGTQKIETLPCYLSQVSTEPDLLRKMPRELRHDILEYFAKLPHTLDGPDRALYKELYDTM